MRKTFTVQELIKSNLAKKLGIENKPNTDQEKNLEDLIDARFMGISFAGLED